VTRTAPALYHTHITSNASNPLRFDYFATNTHAIIVPSCGVDSIPSDALVHLASRTLGHVPLADSTTAAGLHGGVPGGTIASFITACEDVPRNHLALASRDWALSPVPGARSLRGRLVFRLGRLCGGLSVFCLSNRAIVQRTAGLLELAHLSNVLHANSPAYGPAFTYAEFMPTANVVSALLFSLTILVTFATLTFFAPVRVIFYFLFHSQPLSLLLPSMLIFVVCAQIRWLFKRLVRQPGSGPADEYVPALLFGPIYDGSVVRLSKAGWNTSM
jgi:hypothetical protein